MRRLELFASSERILQCAEAAIGADVRSRLDIEEGEREAIADLLVAELLRRAGVPAQVVGHHMDWSRGRVEASLAFMRMECARRPDVERKLRAIAAEIPQMRREAA